MDLVVCNPAWLAIILFGVVAIISGIMLTGRDLDPIERVLPSISGIQKWCGIGILMAAIFVFLASPLTGKHLLEAEKRASQASANLAETISTQIINGIKSSTTDPETLTAVDNAITDGLQAAQDAGYLTSSNITATKNLIMARMGSISTLTPEQEAQIEQGITLALSASMAQASPGALTHKETVTFFNPLSNVWATMLGIFGIMVLVFSQITAKFGDQKPLSTMLIVLWPVIVAMCFFTWRLHSTSSGDVPGVMMDVFIMLIIAAVTVPLSILGMREKPREAGEWAGYGFILLGIDAVYIGIKYLYLFEVEPFLGVLNY